jgi:hypothetical protein
MRFSKAVLALQPLKVFLKIGLDLCQLGLLKAIQHPVDLLEGGALFRIWLPGIVATPDIGTGRKDFGASEFHGLSRSSSFSQAREQNGWPSCVEDPQTTHSRTEFDTTVTAGV